MDEPPKLKVYVELLREALDEPISEPIRPIALGGFLEFFLGVRQAIQWSKHEADFQRRVYFFQEALEDQSFEQARMAFTAQLVLAGQAARDPIGQSSEETERVNTFREKHPEEVAGQSKLVDSLLDLVKDRGAIVRSIPWSFLRMIDWTAQLLKYDDPDSNGKGLYFRPLHFILPIWSEALNETYRKLSERQAIGCLILDSMRIIGPSFWLRQSVERFIEPEDVWFPYEPEAVIGDYCHAAGMYGGDNVIEFLKVILSATEAIAGLDGGDGEVVSSDVDEAKEREKRLPLLPGIHGPDANPPQSHPFGPFVGKMCETLYVLHSTKRERFYLRTLSSRLQANKNVWCRRLAWQCFELYFVRETDLANVQEKIKKFRNS